MHKNEIAYPGPFHGEIDYFHLREGHKLKNVFNSVSEYSKFIKHISGIKIYRDGFGIRVPEDWLELSKQQTVGRSWYGLRPQNTIGFIAISAKNNSQLEEITNREGFEENEYYKNFFEVLKHFVRYTSEAQEFIRRSVNAFLQEKAKEIVMTDSPKGSTTILESVKQKGKVAKTSKKRVTESKDELKKLGEQLTGLNSQFRSSLLFDSTQSKGMLQPLNEISERLNEISRSLSDTEKSLDEMSKISEEANVLKMEFEQMEDQLALFYETVGLGITAESLHHEINNIADRMSDKTHTISTHLKRIQMSDPQLLIFIESIR